MIRAIALVLLLGVAIAGCSRTDSKPDESLIHIRQAGALQVATDPSYPPFSFLDADGEVVGYDVELSRELASRLGVKATFVGIEVTTILDALIAHRADVAVSAVSPVWEYSKQIGFSKGYFNAGQVLVERKGAQQIAGLQQLEMATLGVEVGSSGELEGRKLSKAKPGIALVPFDSLEGGFGALTSGRLNAMIADRVTAAMLLQGQQDLRVAGEPFTNEPYVIAVRASDRALLKQIDAILDAMRVDGFLSSLDKRWIETGS